MQIFLRVTNWAHIIWEPQVCLGFALRPDPTLKKNMYRMLMNVEH